MEALAAHRERNDRFGHEAGDACSRGSSPSSPGACARLLNAVPVSVSIGISELQANESADAWVKQAGDALYRAKNDGRNRVVCRDAAAPQRAVRAP
jgi:hypothetical protein